MAAEIIKKNMLVEFTYSIADETGTIIEQIDLPVNYIHGREKNLHQKIESAMEGHRAGDSFSVQLEPDEGFGAPDPALIFVDEVINVPPQFHQIGAKAEFQNDQGDTKTFWVTNIKDGKITLDANHPLAGKRMTFNLKIFQVRTPSEAELSGQIATGQAAAVPSKTPPTLN